MNHVAEQRGPTESYPGAGLREDGSECVCVCGGGGGASNDGIFGHEATPTRSF